VLGRQSFRRRRHDEFEAARAKLQHSCVISRGAVANGRRCIYKARLIHSNRGEICMISSHSQIVRPRSMMSWLGMYAAC
jgi:hypothetical protein